jgi:hypothetical protein
MGRTQIWVVRIHPHHLDNHASRFHHVQRRQREVARYHYRHGRMYLFIVRLWVEVTKAANSDDCHPNRALKKRCLGAPAKEHCHCHPAVGRIFAGHCVTGRPGVLIGRFFPAPSTWPGTGRDRARDRMPHGWSRRWQSCHYPSRADGQAQVVTAAPASDPRTPYEQPARVHARCLDRGTAHQPNSPSCGNQPAHIRLTTRRYRHARHHLCGIRSPKRCPRRRSWTPLHPAHLTCPAPISERVPWIS